MRMYDIIAKKRDSGTLTRAEIAFAVNGYVDGSVPDYQMSALLMAIYLRGMTDAETAELTDVMAHSGDMVDLSAIQGIKADKHSTGGVGYKTTLVIAPIVAACGVKIAKMSGRGLGHTGGTIDKMESVPGTRTSLTQEEFFKHVNEIGISVIGQSGKIAVADKKLYALRDVTATVGCIPLIASSIMSKKLAAGSDAILLDVTMGSGAFMKNLDEAVELARLMVSIGTAHGRKVAALITDMDTPLGHNIGNSLEVAESMAVLQGKGPADLTEVCLQLASNMLYLAGKGEMAACRAMAEQVIADGSAFGFAAKCLQPRAGTPAFCGMPRSSARPNMPTISVPRRMATSCRTMWSVSATPACCWVQAALKKRTASILLPVSSCTKSWAMPSRQGIRSAPCMRMMTPCLPQRKKCMLAA